MTQGRNILRYLVLVSLLFNVFNFIFFFAVIGGQVIIEQVNHASSCSTEGRGGGRGGRVEREIFVSA